MNDVQRTRAHTRSFFCFFPLSLFSLDSCWMWLANELDEWKKTESERGGARTIGRRIERKRGKESQPVICSFLTFFSSSSFSHDVRTWTCRECAPSYLFDVNKEERKIPKYLIFFFIKYFFISDRILINVDDQYKWKTTPKKPNRLHQFP
jgi:hypothetical protein